MKVYEVVFLLRKFPEQIENNIWKNMANGNNTKQYLENYNTVVDVDK